MLARQPAQIRQTSAVVEPVGGEKIDRFRFEIAPLVESLDQRGAILAKVVGRQQQHVMIAQQRLHLTAIQHRLRLKLHHQFDGLDPFRAAVEEITHEPQMRLAPHPVQPLVDKTRISEQRNHLLILAMNIANDIGRNS